MPMQDSVCTTHHHEDEIAKVGGRQPLHVSFQAARLGERRHRLWERFLREDGLELHSDGVRWR